MRKFHVHLIIALYFFAIFQAQANEIVNGGFEEGIKGWKPLWSREPGAGTVRVDSEEAHGGKSSARIEHKGSKDWSLEPQVVLGTSEGDLFEYSAWVKIKDLDEGSVTLAVSLKDAQGKVCAWTYGRKTVRGTSDWKKISTRFMVPPGIAQIQPRLVGSGSAIIWIDDLDVQKKTDTELQKNKNLPPILSVSNSQLEVTCDTSKSTLSVKNLQSGKIFQQKAKVPEVVVLDASASGDEIKLSLLHLTSLLKLEAKILLEKGSGEILVEMKAKGSFAEPLSYPYPFISEAKEYLVIPMNEGISYPVEDKNIAPIRLVAYGGHGICMPFFGATDGDAGYMGILETPDDAAIFVDQIDEKLCIKPEWMPQRGEFGETRRIRYVFFDKGGHVAIAKRYRSYSQKTGLFKTLAEKRAANPNVDRLIGAVNVWYWGDAIAMAREMKDAGMDHVLWSAARTPEEIRELEKMGFLSSRYDIYQDVMDPENFKHVKWIHPDWTTAGWPKDIILNSEGKWVHGWGVLTKDDKMIDCGVLCDKRAVDYAKERIPNDLKTRPYTCRFIDTTTASEWRECYHPDHPMTRGECKKWRMELLRYVSEENKLVTGSETGHDAAVPYAHYFEGMLSLARYRVPDSGRKMIEVWDDVPENVRKYQVGHEYRLPLWELVYHDCLVAQWYWGDYNNKLPGIWDKRDLFNLLYGTPPMFLFNLENWKKNKTRFVQSYKNTCPYVREVGYSEMSDHKFLTPDRSVQKTVFSNGTKIIVNFGDKPYKLPNGEMLPPMSFRVDKGEKPLTPSP